MKNLKVITLSAFTALALSACGGGGGGGPQGDGILFWSNFGSAYTSALLSLIDDVEAETNIKVNHESQGSYPKLQTNINNSVATRTFPTIATGYPDHFAGYIRSDIMLAMDDYIEEYNEANSVNLLDDYYPEYLTENQELVKGHTLGLPFNKSTEVMTYNVDLFDYVKTLDNTITKLPETWADFQNDGPKYLSALHTAGLFGTEKQDEQGATIVEGGKYLYGKRGADGHVSEFFVEAKQLDPKDTSKGDLLVDFSQIAESDFNLIMWDAPDNLFITLVRQFGGSYTSYTEEDRQSARHGFADFWSGDYKAKTRDALKMVYNLYANAPEGVNSRVFAITDSYNSDAFKAGKVLFTVGSSGGLSYNLPETNKFKVSVAPIPYKDADHKYVISQGANLGLFDQGDDKTIEDAFKVIVSLTKGEIQGKWAATTGYYPATKSATNSKAYQALINEKQETPLKVLYQDSAKLNQENYMKSTEKWIKFVDPGFVGSSVIREEVGKIILPILNKRPDIISGKTTLDQAIDDTLAISVKALEGYIR